MTKSTNAIDYNIYANTFKWHKFYMKYGKKYKVGTHLWVLIGVKKAVLEKLNISHLSFCCQEYNWQFIVKDVEMYKLKPIIDKMSQKRQAKFKNRNKKKIKVSGYNIDEEEIIMRT